MNTTKQVEIEEKLSMMRRWLERYCASAIRLRGVDWFAWATAGGSNAVLLSAETGVAELLVTATNAHILTDEIEAQRLKDEEVPEGWNWQIVPWAELERREQFVASEADGVVLSDRPAAQELSLPCEARMERLVLSASEQERYRQVGQLAATAMSEVMRAARPDWTEFALAGAGAQALWLRGLHPALVLAAGERRLCRYRHPMPSAELLGRRAMLVFCARGFGLYANLTRFACFDARVQQHEAEIMAVEATALDACRAGQPLCAIYKTLESAYAMAGQPEAIREHHQGGITGYLAREVIATAHTQLPLKNGMALAFNPSLRGSKIEDTFLLDGDNLENLSFDPSWPSQLVNGRLRPLCLEA